MKELTVTRFAPSPTGGLHLGGARTAIFNWLFARHYGGKFLLRIEDTDRQRSTQQSIDDILQAMQWLRIDDYDEPVYYQSTHQNDHVQVAERLLDNGHAYRCYCTPEELAEERSKHAQEGKPPKYSGKCRNLKTLKPNTPHTIRLMTPLNQKITVQDMIQGEVTWQSKDLDDLVLVRSDGSPTYMLSVVVDDHNMGVTHVIRGSDHLSNTPKQCLIYEAMGWKVPQFGHVPLIHAADNTKLSKRHGAISIQEYQAQGFLSDALFNYLLRLGWSYGNEEIISREQAVQWFDPKNLGKSSAKFDMVRLLGVNKHYMQKLSTKEIIEAIAPFWKKLYQRPWSTEEYRRLEMLMSELQIRSNTLVALTEACGILRQMNSVDHFTDKGRKILQSNSHVLQIVKDSLHNISPKDWTQENLKTVIEGLSSQKKISKSILAQTVRAAITGSHISPGIYDVLFCLQREESLARLAVKI